MSDKHVTPKEVMDCLRFVRTHLYAAQAQAVPGDDTIITRHVYDAYKRVSDVCNEIEIWGIGMAIPAVYHINATSNAVVETAAWMICEPGCEYGPTFGTESAALSALTKAPPGSELVELVRRKA